VCIAGRSMPIN
jgi:hypothetical protein